MENIFLCVSNEILNEYQEIIGLKTNGFIAENVIQFLINCKYVLYIEPSYHFHLIKEDPDDNKFSDCAVAARATYIVSNDRHFNDVKKSDFPVVDVINISQFLERLTKLEDI